MQNFFIRSFTRLHVLLNRATAGRLFNTLNKKEVVFVTMTGAKSGRKRVFPLMYIPHKNGVLIVASKGGDSKNPAWYNNIATHPEIEVRHRGQVMKLRARLASSDEKPTLWPICDVAWPPFAEYRKKTTRDIPIFICEPITNK